VILKKMPAKKKSK